MPLRFEGRPTAMQWLIIVALAGAALGGFVWVSSVALRWAADYDLSKNQMTQRMMEKKSRQLQRVLDGMIAHDYEEVAKAADEIEELSTALHTFIEGDAYEADRTAFETSLQALQAAVEANDSQAAIDSADRLVDSCMRCHDHLAADPMR